MEANEISKPRTSVAAICSLVFGLLGCIPFVTGLVAVILGIVGINKTKNPMVTGKGMAIAGLILGVLSLLGWTGMIAAGGAGIYAMRQAGEPARVVAEEFARDLSEGKVDAAVALSVQGMDRAALDALVEADEAPGGLPEPRDDRRLRHQQQWQAGMQAQRGGHLRHRGQDVLRDP